MEGNGAFGISNSGGTPKETGWIRCGTKGSQSRKEGVSVLEKYGITCGIMPSTEWSFQQPLPQGGMQRIPVKGCAGTDAELVKQVTFFRVNAGIDVGNVEAEIAAYIRRESPINNRFPGREYPEDIPEPKEKAVHKRPVIERIRDWLRDVSAKRPRLILEDDADVRMEVCAKCHQNIKWKTGCHPCVEAVDARAMNVRQRPSYKGDKKLGACRLHDLHLPTAVFIDRDNLPEVNPSAPEECWMRKVS